MYESIKSIVLVDFFKLLSVYTGVAILSEISLCYWFHLDSHAVDKMTGIFAFPILGLVLWIVLTESFTFQNQIAA